MAAAWYCVMSEDESMKYFLVLICTLTISVYADNGVFSVDLTPCIERDCMTNNIIYDYKPRDNI